MLKRLLVGLFLGLVLGAATAAVLTHAFSLTFVGGFGTLVAYLGAAAVGLLAGLVTGKPIWSSTGKIEAGLKAFFGALLGAGLMFALRKWVHVDVDLAQLGGKGAVGNLPYAALPPIGALLGAFFEVDNTPEPAGDDKAAPGERVRLPSANPAEEAEEEPAAKKAARR